MTEPDDDQHLGLYAKYAVQRLNDTDGKHAGCELFVLDLKHDPYARVAVAAYAEASHHQYPQLAADLRELLEQNRPTS